MAYLLSFSTRITGVLRTLPLLAPRLVTITTGRPVSRSVVPCVPPELSYSSTWSRTQPRVLGSYSPLTGMPLSNTFGAYPPNAGLSWPRRRPATVVPASAARCGPGRPGIGPHDEEEAGWLTGR